jgi:hypothetical protein
MPSISPAVVLLLVALALVGGGILLARASGSQVGIGRRLAAAGQLRVGDLPDVDPLPDRPVRVVGRIRCPDPIISAEDERLVALHRDVDVQLGDGRWRTIERLRLTRGFELYDHDGSLPLDPSLAAEPLVAIPHVWRGSASELTDEAHRAAVERLEQEGRRPAAARSVMRTVSVVDRLLVLARAERDALGNLALSPPPGGYVISALELPDAMRLLGGARRAWLLLGAACIALGIILAVPAAVLLLIG